MVQRSTVTAQGQTSVPAKVRKRFGIRAGSVLEWVEADNQLVVRRVGKYTSKDVHAAAFPKGAPKPKTLAELKAGIKTYIRDKHARR
jgi:AbrB family looped-hinge helix DNA binding protein